MPGNSATSDTRLLYSSRPRLRIFGRNMIRQPRRRHMIFLRGRCLRRGLSSGRIGAKPNSGASVLRMLRKIGSISTRVPSRSKIIAFFMKEKLESDPAGDDDDVQDNHNPKTPDEEFSTSFF